MALSAAAGAALLSCDGDDTPPATFPDASADVVASDVTTDAPDVDGGSDADAGARAKVILVHASPDVPAVRVCFAIGTKNDGSDAVLAPFPPLPDKAVGAQPYPGVFPGTGGTLPDLGQDLSGKVVVPYAVLASKVSTDVATDGGIAPVACDSLIAGDGGLTPGVDYIPLPPIPAGTLKPDTTLLLAATGCFPTAVDSKASAALCGADYDTQKGNVAIKGFVLDRAVADAQKTGTQAAHLSSQVQGLLQGGNATGITVGVIVADAGGYQPVTSNADPVAYGQIKPAPASALSLPPASSAELSLGVLDPDGGPALSVVDVPFASIYTATTGQTQGADQYFVAGANFTFVILGDPTQPFVTDAGVNGYGLHVLAFPNNPPVAKYP